MAEIRRIQQDLEALQTEHQICKQRLESKCDALLIITRDLDQCRQERDQFKLMAEQVQDRYQSLKRQLAGIGPRRALDGREYSGGPKQQSLPQLLCEMRDVNKALQFEVDNLRQKLKDSEDDVKLLREHIARQRVGSTDEGIATRHFAAHEREDLIQQLEANVQKMSQMQCDMRQLIDEKEELVGERDVYKNKFDRLNNELNYLLKGDERRVVDVDALIRDNQYQKERLQQLEEERTLTLATLAKYKTLLDRKKGKGILKLGQTRASGVLVSQKQVQQLLENRATPSNQTVADLQSLTRALLDNLNDKNLALLHQRRLNKILADRLTELEKKVQTCEVSGLWNYSKIVEPLSHLKIQDGRVREDELLQPTDAAKQAASSQTEDCLPGSTSHNDFALTLFPTPSPKTNILSSMDDLDMLPTKELAELANNCDGDDCCSSPNDNTKIDRELFDDLCSNVTKPSLGVRVKFFADHLDIVSSASASSLETDLLPDELTIPMTDNCDGVYEDDVDVSGEADEVGDDVLADRLQTLMETATGKIGLKLAQTNSEEKSENQMTEDDVFTSVT